MSVAVPTQPDIDYHPDLEKYKACTARRLEQNPELLRATLPPGFPAKVEAPIVWEGKDWTSEDQWVYKLRDEELQEIEEAMKVQSFLSLKVIFIISNRTLTGLNKPMGYINRETFPLPNLGPRLYNLAKELYTGRGFFVLRIIPVDRYTRAQLAIIYAG